MSYVLRRTLVLDRSPRSLRGRLVSGAAAAPEPTPAPPKVDTSIDGDAALAATIHEVRAMREAVEQAVEDAEQLRRQSLQEFQQLAVELAVAIAGELVFRVIDAEQFGVESLVSAAVDRLGLDSPLLVSLHPLDVQLLESQTGDKPGESRRGGLTVRPDPTLPRGHCRATNGTTALLSEFGSRLDDIRELLWEGLDDAQIERRQTAGIGAALKRFPDRRQTA
ncbi:MAG: hypothetical protein KF861_03580 [Planctomycetaceae bacterium]|nr:hypothetical protein [Planctomycetaceae bacterium]